MKIDMQVAFCPHVEVDQAVTRENFQHVVEKADPGIDIVPAGTVEVHGNLYIGFRGFSGNFCFAHEELPDV